MLPATRLPVADRRQYRDDRDHPRRLDRGRASSSAADQIAIFLAQVTALGGKVIFGTLIIVVGIFLARIVANLVGSGTGEGGFAQTIVRYAIIALFTAIGLTFMGLADQIVMLAFGLILGSAAIATALAFGLGGRDAAAASSIAGRADGRTGRAAAAAAAASAARPAPTATSSRRWSDDLRRGGRLCADAARIPSSGRATASRRSRSPRTGAPSCSRAMRRTRHSASRSISTRSRS